MSPPDESALGDLRLRIDRIDRDMVGLLAERFACVEQVVEVKRREGLPARNARVEEVVTRVKAQAETAGIPPAFAEHVWRAMIEWVIGYEQTHLSSTAGIQS